MLPRISDSRSNTILLRTKAENAYRRAIRGIIREAERKVIGVEDPNEIQRILRAFMNSVQFEDMCGRAAEQMATTLAVGQQQSWRQAAAKSTRGREIFNALKNEMRGDIGEAVRETIAANAKLIRSVPEELAEKLSMMASKGFEAGKRPEQIAAEMRKTFPQATKGKIDLIARTETAKASTALVEARSEALGLDWYIWRTAKDGKVRSSHDFMDGVVCRWSDPPNPEQLAKEPKSYGNYHPGGIFNCRCIALPVISLSDLSPTVRVHINGSIQVMRRDDLASRYAA